MCVAGTVNGIGTLAGYQPQNVDDTISTITVTKVKNGYSLTAFKNNIGPTEQYVSESIEGVFDLFVELGFEIDE